MHGIFGRTGNAAAGGFAPSGSPAGHWSADTITGLSDGDPIATWPDQSGNGNDLIQGTESRKPIYKVGIQNGLAIVRFDGGDDGMYWTESPRLAQPNTFFFVVHITDALANTAVLLCGASVDYRNQIHFPSTTDIYLQGMTAVDSGKDTTTNWEVLAARFNGASSWVSVDGSQGSNVSAGTTDANGITLGNYINWGIGVGCDIGEVIVYDGAEDPAHNIVGLTAKWGI